MNVNSYIYQSPSSQSVQFGRPNSSGSKRDSSGSSSSLEANDNETFQKEQALESLRKNEIKSNAESGNSIDIYA